MGMTTAATQWLENRGIDIELADRLGLESCERGNGGEWLSIPFLVGEKPVNHKFRRLDQKQFSQDADATKCFWNFDVICDPTLADEPLIITEGEIDALTAIQCGYPRTVSVPDGAPNTEHGEDSDTRKYTYLDHAKGVLRDCKEIILATDGDGPGIALANDLSIRLGKAKCKWVQYPKGTKDLNDAFITFERQKPGRGLKAVQETIKRAAWFRVDGIYRQSELPPYPERQRYSTTKQWLDPHYKIRMGDFCVVTGRPGDGKSTFVNDILCSVVSWHNWTVAVASFEQHPQADHVRALREWHCKMPVHLANETAIEEADAWIEKHFVFIVPGDDDLADLSWTLDKCSAAVIRHGARVVVIDPWNELDHDRPPDMSLTEYTGRAIKEFKRLARSLDVHVIVVAHPTKMQAGDRPGLYSISDSAHWANKPDVGLVVYKPDPTARFAEIHQVKSRYHEQIGTPGMVMTMYDPATRRFDKAEVYPDTKQEDAK